MEGRNPEYGVLWALLCCSRGSGFLPSVGRATSNFNLKGPSCSEIDSEVQVIMIVRDLDSESAPGRGSTVPVALRRVGVDSSESESDSRADSKSQSEAAGPLRVGVRVTVLASADDVPSLLPVAPSPGGIILS